MRIIYTPKGRADEYARTTKYPDHKPLACNFYKGCSHGCLYCYVPGVLRCSKEQFHSEISIRKNALEDFERDCSDLMDNFNLAPIFLSFTTDPYQPIEDNAKITREAIQIAHKYGQSVNILTKAGTKALRDLDVLTNDDILGTTLTTIEYTSQTYYEPGAASSADRVSMLMEAHKAGIQTRVSFEPVLKPQEVELLAYIVAPHVDLIQVGKLNYHAGELPICTQIRGDIDWRVFAGNMTELLPRLRERYGCNYYIKDDLRAHLEGSDG
ncbi:MAG: SPL family radical SAM protein [Armatimonadota bacterium]